MDGTLTSDVRLGYASASAAVPRDVGLPGSPGRVRSASILGLAAGLMAIGAIISFSARTGGGSVEITQPWWESTIIRQLAFVTAGLAAMLLAARVPYHIWFAARGRMALIPLLFGMITLGLVFVPGIGVEVNGARRWISIPGVGLQFQPSEVVKVALPIFLASWLVYRRDIRRFWRGLLPVALVIGFCTAAVGIEDFGTAALMAAVAGAMLIVAGARWWHLAIMAMPAIPGFLWLIVSRPHRIERLKIFLDPWADPEGSGYQIIQSLCTIASGGWWGRGLGGGFVKGYLPQAHNDFIFAVICEELGIVGAIAVIGLFIAFMWQCRGVLVRCISPAGRLLAFGIAMTLGLQAALNIAVVTSSVPTKGISLPLVSAGGTGAIVLGAVVGLLANLARKGTCDEELEKVGVRSASSE